MGGNGKARQRWRPGNGKARQPGNGKDSGLATARHARQRGNGKDSGLATVR